MTTFEPTDEQAEAMGLFAGGADVAIEAGAGTGKTTTLVHMARATPRVGQYLAFNRAIVDEAQHRFPATTHVSTVHSLAMRSVGHRYGHRINSSQRQRSGEVARKLGLTALDVLGPLGRKRLSPSWLASYVTKAVDRFCESADDEPGPAHFPRVPFIDRPGEDTNNAALAAHLADALATAWADVRDPNGWLRFNHGHYLKIWCLEHPELPADYVLFDEAQDAAPVMIQLVKDQRNAQQVWVGDSQQQIYEWRGAVNAMANLGADVRRTWLTESWRFGPPIAHVANALLAELGAELRLTGRGGPSSLRHLPEGTADAVLCRTNAVAMSAMLSLQAAGRNPHLVGGGKEVLAFAKAAAALQGGDKAWWHPELACFESWGEVQAYVEQDPSGDELALLVSLVDNYGVDTILHALDGMVGERGADLVVSTAHKAKGREWPAVHLAGDFTDPGDDPGGAGEWRLLYVAATRAATTLDHGACRPIRGLVGPPAGTVRRTLTPIPEAQPA